MPSTLGRSIQPLNHSTTKKNTEMHTLKSLPVFFSLSTSAAPAQALSFQVTNSTIEIAAPNLAACNTGELYCFSEIVHDLGTLPLFPSLPPYSSSNNPSGWKSGDLGDLYCKLLPNPMGCESCVRGYCECTFLCYRSYFRCVGPWSYQWEGRCIARPGQPCARGVCLP